MDGEPTIINGILNKEFLNNLHENNINICKLPSSTSSETQPLDLSIFFKNLKINSKDYFNLYESIKKYLLDPFKEDKIIEKPENSNKNLSFIKNFNEKIEMFRMLNFYKNTTFSKKQKNRKMIVGAILITLSIYDSYNNRNIKNSWEKSGIYPFNTEKIFSPWLEKVKDNSNIDINSSDFVEKLNVAVNNFKINSFNEENLLTSNFNEYNKYIINPYEMTIKKSSKTNALSRFRACILDKNFIDQLNEDNPIIKKKEKFTYYNEVVNFPNTLPNEIMKRRKKKDDNLELYEDEVEDDDL